MDNYTIADNFSLLAKLMDIHGENSFKTKSYSSAAFTIEKLPVELATLPAEKIFAIKGVGENIGKKIIEQITTGRLTLLDEYIEKTPPGIQEMMTIKGIGPKKIAVIWKELEVESLGELLYACNENRLTLYKGFGEKTQQNIKESIEFFLSNKGSYLFAQIEQYAAQVDDKLKTVFKDQQFELAGDFRRHLEIIEKIEWVTTTDTKTLRDFFIANEFEIVVNAATESAFKGKENVLLVFYHSTPQKFYQTLFEKSCSPEFLEAWVDMTAFNETYTSEADIFLSCNKPVVPAFLRERKTILNSTIPEVIQANDITGIIHCHSKWSDGANTLADMALAAKNKGLQFLVISDHSKTAFYAQGLTEDRLIAQHKEIDELNARLLPFKIYKSIESDILNDGSLDYSKDVLESFDLVIASVHANLKMKEDKAMMRLINAIENPYTTILGHMTGRLLLSRSGYPVDHKKIIDACAANNVVIELNAHPKRLDIDWRWLHYCLEKNVLISIDPDAHSIEGFNDVRYGVMAAQKGGITKERNLSSFSLADFEAFLAQQRTKRT